MLSILSSTSVGNRDYSAENKSIPLIDSRGWLAFSTSICFSLFKEGISRIQRINNPYKTNAKVLFPSLQSDGTYPEKLHYWRKGNSSRLIVLIHGLNSSPLCWNKYIQKLSTEESTDLFVPYVYKKCYCRIKEAAKPIFESIQKYADQYEQIILVGHSRGASIAQYIEMKLEAKNVTLISIAGPHLGSKLIDWTTYLGLNYWLGISNSMANELKYDSDWVNRKLIKWQEKSLLNTHRVAKRIFIASTDDFRVFPSQSSFPNLPSSTYLLVSGESHVTIIEAAYGKVLAEIS